jgi:hypothetical protein
MNKQIASNATRIMTKLGFPEAQIRKADKDRVVVNVPAKFRTVRTALSRQYGHCQHNLPVGKGRRATWVLNGKGTIVAKGPINGPSITLSFATMPFIKV